MAKAQYAAPWSICVYRRLGRVIDELGLLIGAWRVYCTWIPFYAGPQHTHTHIRSLRVLSHCSRSFRILGLFVSLLFCNWFFNVCKIRMLLLLCIYFLFGGIFVALSWHSEARKWHSNKTLYADNRFQYDTSLFESRESEGEKNDELRLQCMWVYVVVIAGVYSLTLSHFVFVVVNLSFVVVWIVKPLIALRNGIKLAPIFHAIHQYQNLYLSSFFCWQM